jgi:DNA mismatch repair protein MutH
MKPIKIASIGRRLTHTAAVSVACLLGAEAITFLQTEVRNLRAELSIWEELHPDEADEIPPSASVE